MTDEHAWIAENCSVFAQNFAPSLHQPCRGRTVYRVFCANFCTHWLRMQVALRVDGPLDNYFNIFSIYIVSYYLAKLFSPTECIALHYPCNCKLEWRALISYYYHYRFLVTISDTFKIFTSKHVKILIDKFKYISRAIVVESETIFMCNYFETLDLRTYTYLHTRYIYTSVDFYEHRNTFVTCQVLL